MTDRTFTRILGLEEKRDRLEDELEKTNMYLFIEGKQTDPVYDKQVKPVVRHLIKHGWRVVGGDTLEFETSGIKLHLKPHTGGWSVFSRPSESGCWVGGEVESIPLDNLKNTLDSLQRALTLVADRSLAAMIVTYQNKVTQYSGYKANLDEHFHLLLETSR